MEQSQEESNYFSGKTLCEIPEVSKSELYSSTLVGVEKPEEESNATLSQQPPYELIQAVSTILQERSQGNYPRSHISHQPFNPKDLRKLQGVFEQLHLSNFRNYQHLPTLKTDHEQFNRLDDFATGHSECKSDSTDHQIHSGQASMLENEDSRNSISALTQNSDDDAPIISKRIFAPTNGKLPETFTSKMNPFMKFYDKPVNKVDFSLARL